MYNIRGRGAGEPVPVFYSNSQNSNAITVRTELDS